MLRQAISDALGMQWKIEAVVDPSGGSQPGPAAQRSAPAGPAASAPASPAPPAPAPVRSAPAAPPQPAPSPSPSPAPAPSAPARQAPPPVAIEDDIPEEDDPDLDEAALSGYDLIVRELGATVIEEISHE